MRNFLAIKIETRIGIAVIAIWATLFLVTVYRARANFDNYLAALEAQTPLVRTAARIEQRQITGWLQRENLNEYGDPHDTVYAGGTPLFDETTGEHIDVRRYLVQKFPQKPWKNFTKYE